MWHSRYSINIEGLLCIRHWVNMEIGEVGRDQTVQSQVKFCLCPKSKGKPLNNSKKG